MSSPKNSLEALRIDRSAAPRHTGAWVALVCLILLLAAGGVAAWWYFVPGAIPVRTVVAERIAAEGAARERTLLNASGYVTARREATVSSKVTGKVVEVLVEEGMRVEADQVLARLDDSNVRSSLQLAEAHLEAAKRTSGETEAELAQAKRELDRLTRAAQVDAATPLELERAQSLVESLEARLERQEADVLVAEREVAVWQQQLDDTIIRAPFAGVVTAKNAQPGEMISPMSVGGFTRTGICTIVDMSSLEIEIDVNESYINRVHPGQAVLATLDAYPEWQIPASVIAIIPTADRQKATVKVRVGFDELDPRILPDMSVKVAFRGDVSDGDGAAGVLLPDDAVDTRDGRKVVWVVRDGRAERRAVTVGDARGNAVVVLAGLQGGERVVVDPSGELRDGAAVRETRQ